MSVLTAIQAIQDAMIAVTGIKSAPDYMEIGELPTVITHLAAGVITPGNPAGARLELNQIDVELHVSESGSRSAAFATLETLHPLVVAALVADVTFGGNLQTFSDITFTTTASSLDGVYTLSRIYTLNNAKIIA